MKMHSRHETTRGFSLIELLFAMAIISMLSAVAMFSLSDVNGAARSAKSKRNAQSICSLFQSARSVGVEFNSTSKEGILDELIKGKSGKGALSTSVFQLSLDSEERASALAFCMFDPASKAMVFNPRIKSQGY